MNRSALVTGGAGFIGRSLVDALLSSEWTVTVADNLDQRTHPTRARPSSLAAAADLEVVDVTDASAWPELVARGFGTIVHLAAETSTALSLEEAGRHVAVNVLGTTTILDALARVGPLDHLVLASSRAVYGEGAWTAGDKTLYPGPRQRRLLELGQWDPVGPGGEPLAPIPSNSSTTLTIPSSVYGATKLAQENVCRAWCAAHDTPLTILRLQNVYGPGQPSDNPNVGVLSYFVSTAAAGRPIQVFEDGEITRDFVYVDDAVDALSRAIAGPPAGQRCVDVGSGTITTILEVARMVAKLCGGPEPEVSGRFRLGDVRAAGCDVRAAETVLGHSISRSLADGVEETVEAIRSRADG